MITTVTLNTSIDKLYIVDSLQTGTVMRVKQVNNTAGGKGLNVTKIAAKAGEKVLATGILGGFSGQYLKSMIKDTNITLYFAETSGETRSCINILDLSSGKSTEFLEPGCEVNEDTLEAFLNIYAKCIEQSQVITISGSTPKGIPEDFYCKLIEMGKNGGKKVILDASGNLLKEGIKAKPTMIKPNQDEIKQLTGRDISTLPQLIEAAEMLHQSGIEYAVISMGKQGAVVAAAEGVFHGIPPEIEAVNTVGCGDSMTAGFAIGISRGYTAEETIRFAVAVSAASAMTMETGSFEAEDLKSLLCQVKVNKIK